MPYADFLGQLKQLRPKLLLCLLQKHLHVYKN